MKESKKKGGSVWPLEPGRLREFAGGRPARGTRGRRLAARLPGRAGAARRCTAPTPARDPCVGATRRANTGSRAAGGAHRGVAHVECRGPTWRARAWARRASRRSWRRSRPRSPRAVEEGQAADRAPHFCSGCPPPAPRAGARAPRSRPARTRRRDRLRHDGAADARARGALHRRDGLRGRALDRPRAAYTDAGHLFQNLGDGTYFHSGRLAVRACVEAGVPITFESYGTACGRDDRRPGGDRREAAARARARPSRTACAAWWR